MAVMARKYTPPKTRIEVRHYADGSESYTPEVKGLIFWSPIGSTYSDSPVSFPNYAQAVTAVNEFLDDHKKYFVLSIDYR